MCAHVHIRVCACGSRYVCSWVEVERQKVTLGAPLYHLLPVFQIRSVFELELIDWSDWLASRP